MQLNSSSIKYERTKLSKKKDKKNLSQVNPSQYDKLVTHGIRGEPTRVNSPNLHLRSRDPDNLVEKKT